MYRQNNGQVVAMYDMYTNGYNENWYTHKTMNLKNICWFIDRCGHLLDYDKGLKIVQYCYHCWIFGCK